MMVAKNYTDNQGVEKTQWVKIGSVIDNGIGQDGKRKLFGNIDAMPTFEWDGSINLFEQEQQQQGYAQPQQQGGQQPNHTDYQPQGQPQQGQQYQQYQGQ